MSLLEEVQTTYNKGKIEKKPVKKKTVVKKAASCC